MRAKASVPNTKTPGPEMSYPGAAVMCALLRFECLSGRLQHADGDVLVVHEHVVGQIFGKHAALQVFGKLAVFKSFHVVEPEFASVVVQQFVDAGLRALELLKGLVEGLDGFGGTVPYTSTALKANNKVVTVGLTYDL